MDPARIIFILGVLVLTGLGAMLDARWKRLPNRLAVSAFVLGLVFNVGRGAVAGGWPGAGAGLRLALAGFAIGFGTLLILWLIGGGGGGDVKFMGALGAWLGPVLTMEVLVAATGLACAISLLGFAREVSRFGASRAKRRERAVREAVAATSAGSSGVSDRQRRLSRRYVPFGVPVAFATWVLLILALAAGWPKLPV